MFTILLFFHSLIRWFVLGSLVYAICRAYRGYSRQLPFSKTDDSIRHYTATIAHIQLMLGIYIYTQSDTVKSLFSGIANADRINEPVFFGMIHISMMLIAIIIITVGSAKSKLQITAHDKFKTMLVWFSIALFVIFMAIPWPFSPLAHRPYLRSF